MGKLILTGQLAEEQLARLSDVLLEPLPRGAPLVDAGMRMELLRMREEQLMFWAAGALAGARPRLVRLPPLAQATLEGWMSWIAGKIHPSESRRLRRGKDNSRQIRCSGMPVVTIALPALAVPAFRDAVIGILQDDWREG